MTTPRAHSARPTTTSTVIDVLTGPTFPTNINCNRMSWARYICSGVTSTKRPELRTVFKGVNSGMLIGWICARRPEDIWKYFSMIILNQWVRNRNSYPPWNGNAFVVNNEVSCLKRMPENRLFRPFVTPEHLRPAHRQPSSR
ncbi:hypothetical protein SprV_0602141100 [Sparganum proliferum]